ncbi:TolC family protein [Terrimonas sp. NA20]|uniref:TolC family protein n=1 Tax=Terrimonas ginsenosidimutans TaxID=2908004 RepID=A0ABS9KPB0_9BACT|nr:TolC family protein [Terrimonas ginsenosidimutans]MCG2614141.1 TolC family protein [Terrimonas ginsenosidimutans]
MMTRCIQLVICLFAITTCYAQDKWDLQQCVDYALKNNISVRQADVQARIYALTYQQNKLSQLPSANFQNSGGYNFGRSIDPATNSFTTQEILFTNHSLNINLDLFNWFSKRNTVAATRLQAEAYVAGAEKARNDVALNVANAYLQILLNAEQINISDVQVKQSIEQLNIVTKQVKAGALPELNAAELEAQLANDSSTLITARANYTLSVLQLKAVLNIPADQAFEVAIPPVEQIPVESLADLDPAAVYQLAQANMPQQKINTLNLQAAIKNVAAVRGQMYPSLTLFGNLDSRYSNAQRRYVTQSGLAFLPIGNVSVNGTNYTVTTQEEQIVPLSYGKNTYFRQLNNNFSQSIGLGLSIPIFNGGIARTNWRKAQLNVTSVELQKEQDALTLKQDIYQSHNNAVAALQKFNASRKGVETAQKAYDFAKKRFDVGLLNTIDLITNQNNLFRAKINLVSAQYDYVFKMKLLEFYKGLGLKL